MKVYILTTFNTECENTMIVGVFGSYDKANVAKTKAENDYNNRHCCCYYISEHEIK